MKITRNLYLEVLRRGRLIRRSSILISGPERMDEDLYPKFLPYLEGKGDVEVGMEDLDLEGYDTEVVEVYRTLRREVPFGRTVTYGELGRMVGRHPRFVAYCMRINRFPVIIPCHRVVGIKDLGGFSYGRDLKLRLLLFERGEL